MTRVAFLLIVVILGIAATVFMEPQMLNSRIQKLVSESKEKKSIRESKLSMTNPLKNEDLGQAIELIAQQQDYTSYHLLLAIRTYFPEAYKGIPNEQKIIILVSMLSNARFLNDWSSLEPEESFDRDGAVALLETGKPAIPALVHMLDDVRDAPLFGSQEATLSADFKYRRKDFSYRYISLLCGRQPSFDADPAKRDEAIHLLKASLKNKSK